MGRLISWFITIALTIIVIIAIIEAFSKILPLLLITVLLAMGAAFYFKSSKTFKKDTNDYIHYSDSGFEKINIPDEPESKILADAEQFEPEPIEVSNKPNKAVINKSFEPEPVEASFNLHPDVSSWNSEIPSDYLTDLLSHRPFYDNHESRCVADGRADLPQRFGDLSKFIVLDIETTGLSPTNDRIIEIAAVKFEGFKVVDAFETLINPEIPLPKRISNLTGITTANVEAAPRWNDIKSAFIDFLRDYPLVGHNLSRFDLRFVENAAGQNLPNPVVDTLDYSRSIFPNFPSYKLNYLQQVLELNADPTHRALDDVKTTFFLLAACIKQDSTNEPVYSTDTVSNSYVPPIPERVEHKYRKKVSPKDIAVQTIDVDSNHPLYGKRIVFTGELNVIRAEAMKMAAKCGALLRTSVSGKTDFLVVGKQDIAIVGASGISSKEATALLLNEQNKAHIQIINESEFYELIGDVPN